MPRKKKSIAGWNVYSELLPETFPRIRSLARRDLPLIVSWLGQARREGVFRAGPPVTPASVGRFHRSIRDSGWNYACRIVEDPRGPIGYIDFRWRRRRGEILGLFLEVGARSRRLGRHLMRYAVAELREYGCREVLTEIYESNIRSRRACEAAGFTRLPARDRREDGKSVHAWRRHIAPFRRLQPLNPRYFGLQGENIYLHHVATAEAVADELCKLPGVTAILGLGSVARGFADDSSDVDMMVLGRGGTLKTLRTGEHFAAGTSVDLFAVDLDLAPVACWPPERREAVLEGLVLWQTHGIDLGRIVSGCRLSKREQAHCLAEVVLKLGWVGMQPTTWSGRTLHGYHWGLPHDVWVQRGCVDAAHLTLDYGLDLTLQALYLVNGRLPADPKWRFFLAVGLPWQPPRLTERLRRLVRSRRGRKDIDRRARELRSLVGEVVEQAKRRRLLPSNLYGEWLRVASDYATDR